MIKIFTSLKEMMQFCFLILLQGFPGCLRLLLFYWVYKLVLMSDWEAEIISADLHSEGSGLAVMNLQFKMLFSPFLGPNR